MNVYPLIKKLIEIERALGKCDTISLRNLVVEAEDCALELQKEALESRAPQVQLQVADEA